MTAARGLSSHAAASTGRGRRGHSGATSKKVSRKWQEDEVQSLMDAINRLGGVDGVNWADVSKAVPGRTGKQCREKWKNDLRPDINKDPWSTREEYILARAHCQVGNQWAEIAKFLPGRSENSIKNHWNATLRSKAESKTRTFLWTYGRVVLDQSGVTSWDSFEKAIRNYKLLANTEPLDKSQVPEEYFAQQAAQYSAGSPIKVKLGRCNKRAAARSTRRTRPWSQCSDSSCSEESDTESDDLLGDDDDTLPQSNTSSQTAPLRHSKPALPPLNHKTTSLHTTSAGTTSKPLAIPRVHSTGPSFPADADVVLRLKPKAADCQHNMFEAAKPAVQAATAQPQLLPGAEFDLDWLDAPDADFDLEFLKALVDDVADLAPSKASLGAAVCHEDDALMDLLDFVDDAQDIAMMDTSGLSKLSHSNYKAENDEFGLTHSYTTLPKTYNEVNGFRSYGHRIDAGLADCRPADEHRTDSYYDGYAQDAHPGLRQPSMSMATYSQKSWTMEQHLHDPLGCNLAQRASSFPSASHLLGNGSSGQTYHAKSVALSLLQQGSVPSRQDYCSSMLQNLKRASSDDLGYGELYNTRPAKVRSFSMVESYGNRGCPMYTQF